MISLPLENSVPASYSLPRENLVTVLKCYDLCICFGEIVVTLVKSLPYAFRPVKKQTVLENYSEDFAYKYMLGGWKSGAFLFFDWSVTHTQWVLNPQPHPLPSTCKDMRCQLS